MEKQEIINILSESICEIVFQKVTNGHFRVMYGTRSLVFIPRGEHERLIQSEAYIESLAEYSKKEGIENLVIVWDFINHDWRSFYSTTLLYIDTNKERTLIKQYDGLRRKLDSGKENEE
jgi:hypothetical protein